ncbi:hypothetical protein BCR34DRAFT_229213 [Clohesyomyces aquaticus]|uniref:Uncharacterized protein n=1 Tax=Clohesyomyces aquaticus TaxID=1231657 RepID=A0A1Y1ZXT8_9PLEO|nr:hypothetical protein BCR34DRAFT_229213 [Clohesyomyces aquaticus]
MIDGVPRRISSDDEIGAEDVGREGNAADARAVTLPCSCVRCLNLNPYNQRPRFSTHLKLRQTRLCLHACLHCRMYIRRQSVSTETHAAHTHACTYCIFHAPHTVSTPPPILENPSLHLLPSCVKRMYGCTHRPDIHAYIHIHNLSHSRKPHGFPDPIFCLPGKPPDRLCTWCMLSTLG